MSNPAKLGGFKALKDIIWFSLISPKNDERFPAKFCRTVAREKINLPCMTCLPDGPIWRLDFSVDAVDEARTLNLIRRDFGNIITRKIESIIITIFPHKGDPCISALFLEALGNHGVEPEALANSPAAVSAIVRQEGLTHACNALFSTFSFSAYRTPYDWKLAQKGKEILYKEVVASYQESRPKVYGLRYREEQEFLSVKFNEGNLSQFGSLLREFGGLGSYLSFLGAYPGRENGKGTIVFCLSRGPNQSHKAIVRRIASHLEVENIHPVAAFSMTGPHFGDRYGIASELLTSFDRSGVQLVALNCSIATVKGIVPFEQMRTAIDSIKDCFEVPTLIRKG